MERRSTIDGDTYRKTGAQKQWADGGRWRPVEKSERRRRTHDARHARRRGGLSSKRQPSPVGEWAAAQLSEREASEGVGGGKPQDQAWAWAGPIAGTAWTWAAAGRRGGRALLGWLAVGVVVLAMSRRAIEDGEASGALLLWCDGRARQPGNLGGNVGEGTGGTPACGFAAVSLPSLCCWLVWGRAVVGWSGDGRPVSQSDARPDGLPLQPSDQLPLPVLCLFLASVAALSPFLLTLGRRPAGSARVTAGSPGWLCKPWQSLSEALLWCNAQRAGGIALMCWRCLKGSANCAPSPGSRAAATCSLGETAERGEGEK